MKNFWNGNRALTFTDDHVRLDTFDRAPDEDHTPVLVVAEWLSPARAQLIASEWGIYAKVAEWFERYIRLPNVLRAAWDESQDEKNPYGGAMPIPGDVANAISR